MRIGHKNRIQARLIGWALVAALFVLTVQPMHVHLEHLDAVSEHDHDHVIGLHFSVDNVAPANHNDAVFPLTPEGLLKKSGDNPFIAVILVYLSLLLLSAACSSRLRQIILRFLPGTSWYSISPPLRAPPSL